jgi:DNA-binding XRE family transcriptional regulator
VIYTNCVCNEQLVCLTSDGSSVILTPVDGFYERFGRRLREMRKGAELTQDQVASRLGVNRTTLVNIEKGRQRVALDQVIELANILGCDAAELLPTNYGTEPEAIAGVAAEGAQFVSGVRSQRSRS